MKFYMLLLICLLHFSTYTSVNFSIEDSVTAQDLEKARQYAIRNIADIATISDIEQSATKFMDTLIAHEAKRYSPKNIEKLKHEIRKFYLDAKMQSFIKEIAQKCRALNITRTNMDIVDNLSKKHVAQLGIPNDPAYQPIVYTAQEELKKIISELPARMPLTERDRQLLAIQKARQYASNHLASISTIPDIEESIKIFANLKAAEKSEDYSPELLEKLKHEIRQFYLNAKMITFIKQIQHNIQQLTLHVSYSTDSDKMTKNLTEQLHIPNDTAYEPVISTIKEELDKIIKHNDNLAEIAVNQANSSLFPVPKTLDELIAAIQQFQKTNNFGVNINHQAIVNIFRDTLERRMVYEEKKQRDAELEKNMSNFKRATDMTSAESQDLKQVHRENRDQSVLLFWQELLRKYCDTKLKKISENISLEKLSQEQLDDLIKKVKQEIINDGILLNFSIQFINDTQEYFEKSLKKSLSAQQKATTKRSITFNESKNTTTVIDSRLLAVQFQETKNLIIALKNDPNIDQTALQLLLDDIFSNLNTTIKIEPEQFITATSIPKKLTTENLDTIVRAINKFKQKTTSNSTAAAAASATAGFSN
jgi:hypothetical protein